MDPILMAIVKGACYQIGSQATKGLITRWAERLRNKKSTSLRLAANLHIISHAIRDFMYPDDLDEDVERQATKMAQQVVEAAKLSFDQLTGVETAVCIKLMDKSALVDSVRDFARDMSSSTRRRAGPDSLSPIKDNIDFYMLFNRPYHYSSFLGLDLVEAWKRGEYENSHGDFGQYYQSTIVAPIRAWRADKRDYDVVGFLCIDSLHPKAFNSAHVQLAGAIGDALYIPFEFYSGLFDKKDKLSRHDGGRIDDTDRHVVRVTQLPTNEERRLLPGADRGGRGGAQDGDPISPVGISPPGGTGGNCPECAKGSAGSTDES